MVPFGNLAGLVVGDAVGLHLFRREVGGDHHRDFLQAETLRGLKPCVTADDDVVFVHDNR